MSRYDDKRAARVIAMNAAKRAARPAVMWGVIFGGTIAASASTYNAAFPTAASRKAVALATSGNAGFSALFGRLHGLDTVQGYTAYKSGYFTIILGAIWGLLIATKLTRGEEDAGRWELFLAGRTTRARAVVQSAIGLGIAFLALWLPTALLTIMSGSSPKVGIGAETALFFVTALLSAAAMFMAVGLFAGQLAGTRHDANLIGAGAIAASYMIRMVADTDASIGWLRWLSPFGWIEELRPLTGSKPLGFVPIVLLTVVLLVATVRLAAQRDIGSSVFASRDTPKPRTVLLGSHAGLSLRLTRTGVIAWVVVLVVTGLVVGLVTQAAGKAVKSSPAFEQVLGRLGAERLGAVAYLSFVFVMAAGLVSVAVCGQIASMRNEESSGHLDNLLVRRVARWKWLAFRVGIGIVLVVVASVLTGIAAWAGAASQNAAVGFGEMVRAGVNVAPPALFVLGIGVLAFGVVPRASIGIAYALVIWSFFVETIASIFDSNHWLRDTAPLLHMSPAPAAAPDWTSAAALVVLGLAASVAGVVAFSRRDLIGA